MAKLIIKNIGTIVSGDIRSPVISGSVIRVEDALITAVGGLEVLETGEDITVIDANGTTVTPGLFDSHVHTTIGDYAHRHSAAGFLDSELHGGVTTVISAGEAHMPGRPKDPAGVMALAVLACKSFYNAPPSGMKVHAGALILEKGLTESDFKTLREQGVWIVGEVGLGSVQDPEEAAVMVQWAHKYGMKVQMHAGGTSIPGSSTITAADVIAVKPDVISHINGGPTAVSPEEAVRMMDETDFAIEIVQCGNSKMTDFVARRAKEKRMLPRIIFGNDAPSGTGVISLGILRNVCQVSSISGIEPEFALCMATGNTAGVYGLNAGIISPGREADFVIMDAPMGSVGGDALGAISAGDIPGISAVIINGKLAVKTSRNTPPAKRQIII
jgi:enamidase